MNGWTIDHVAIVVGDLDATLRLYTQTLGFAQLYRETVADQGVEAVGIRSGDSVIELLRPLDAESAIAKFRGEAATKLHHIAYRVDNCAETLEAVKASGARVIDDVPRPGSRNTIVAFVHPKSSFGTLIELVQESD